MLMELMLAIAIAATLIPFVFRYQKNTIERARNVAIVRQMGLVQRALEKCIEDNQSDFTQHVGDTIFSSGNECFVLKEGDRGLIRYGLTDAFADDYGEDYVIRVLKTKDVLQGVVLLQNAGITALRTREIVDIGGGALGAVQNDVVRGGYNSFNVQKKEFGLTDVTNGIVKTTATIRGQVADPYVWRVTGGSATMESDFYMGSNDIINVGTLQGTTLNTLELKYSPLREDSGIYADNLILAKDTTDTSSSFNFNRDTWKFTRHSNGYITQAFIGSDKDLAGTGNLTVPNELNDKLNAAIICTDFNVGNNLNINNTLDEVYAAGGATDNNLGTFKAKDVNLANVYAKKIEIVKSGTAVSIPTLGFNCIVSDVDSDNPQYYWSPSTTKSNSKCPAVAGAHIKDVILKGPASHDANKKSLFGRMKTLINYENEYWLSSWIGQKVKPNLSSFQKMQGIISEEIGTEEFLRILLSIKQQLTNRYGIITQ